MYMELRIVLVVAAAVAIAVPVRAGGNSGESDANFGIGGIRTFPSEGQAKAACGRDTVVWADRYAGYLYFRREKEYGKTTQGSFTCLKIAQGGNYWSTGPMSSIGRGHGPGRNFPFTPIPSPNMS